MSKDRELNQGNSFERQRHPPGCLEWHRVWDGEREWEEKTVCGGIRWSTQRTKSGKAIGFSRKFWQADVRMFIWVSLFIEIPFCSEYVFKNMPRHNLSNLKPTKVGSFFQARVGPWTHISLVSLNKNYLASPNQQRENNTKKHMLKVSRP